MNEREREREVLEDGKLAEAPSLGQRNLHGAAFPQQQPLIGPSVHQLIQVPNSLFSFPLPWAETRRRGWGILLAPAGLVL